VKEKKMIVVNAPAGKAGSQVAENLPGDDEGVRTMNAGGRIVNISCGLARIALPGTMAV
jgi:hypothetical protein